MFVENPSEGFIIESLTSATRYYSPSLKCLLYALGREGEGKIFFFKEKSVHGRGLPFRAVGWPAVNVLIIEEACGPLRGRQPFWQGMLLLLK